MKRYAKVVVFILSGILAAGSAFAKTIKVVNYGVVLGNVNNTVAAQNKTRIQNAINAAISGDRIEFPKGILCYYGLLTFQNKSNLTVYGFGKDSETDGTVLKAKDRENSTIGFYGTGRDSFNFYIVVRDLQIYSPIDGDLKTGDTTTSGFFAEQGSNIEFRNVRVKNMAGSGIVFFKVKNSGVWDSVVQNAHLSGIQINQWALSVVIERNTISHTGDDNVATVGANTNYNQYISINNNNLSYAGEEDSRLGSGITVGGSKNVTIFNNNIDHSACAGIRIESEGAWSERDTDEVSVTYNDISYCPLFLTNQPSILVYTSTNYNIMNIHFNYNNIYHPQSVEGFALYGVGSGTGWVLSSQVNNSQIFDPEYMILCPVNIGPRTSNVTEFNNIVIW